MHLCRPVLYTSHVAADVGRSSSARLINHRLTRLRPTYSTYNIAVSVDLPELAFPSALKYLGPVPFIPEFIDTEGLGRSRA